MKELENSQFLHELGDSQETFFLKLYQFRFKKRAVDLILSSEAFQNFYLTKSF